MKEYIDKAAFLERMKGTNRYFDVRFDIEEFPAADVVEIVRCKDCKHQIKTWTADGRRKDGGIFQYSCQINEKMGLDEEFCSSGERKE